MVDMTCYYSLETSFNYEETKYNIVISIFYLLQSIMGIVTNYEESNPNEQPDTDTACLSDRETHEKKRQEKDNFRLPCL